ncbi:MAG: GNAT family N-acetyltransferase [Bradyrhizobiaceae bacterium]|nr:MAG: GNAT family N-acetyltransferase [Bradyrhizobiaceae bacterium]
MALREARRDEVGRILDMLVDDDLARTREDLSVGLEPYLKAFDEIAADPDNFLYVWEEAGEIVGSLQLTFIPGIAYQGAWLAQVESVRVDSTLRGQRIGEKMMQAAMEIARRRGCRSMQLKTDKRRVAAHRFYQRLGFAHSHEAMTIKL